ncbi:hypothetical protein Taro_026468 [Colocasia esculenta]|uniref:Uncharacterized protein n=1 Tax=Colocasia esculenta TaxID=4460 RepID=A0A843VFA0_COLES|nr:hypothetical protein [Colocasia esculenta]
MADPPSLYKEGPSSLQNTQKPNEEALRRRQGDTVQSLLHKAKLQRRKRKKKKKKRKENQDTVSEKCFVLGRPSTKFELEFSARDLIGRGTGHSCSTCYLVGQAVQVAAARLLSMLCFVSARVQPYSSENAFSVLDDLQLKDLSSSINEILMDEDGKNEELLISVINLLVSAAHFQVCDVEVGHIFFIVIMEILLLI